MRRGSQQRLYTLAGLLLMALVSTPTTRADDARFYVSADGNDRWSGTLAAPNARGDDGPFATLERARDAVRQLRGSGKLKTPVTVAIRGGTFVRRAPFVLSPKDSGTEQYPITYSAYPGETPVLSGGRKIVGWRRGRGDRWVAQLPDVKAGKWTFRQLFVNGQPRRRARLPKEGTYTILGGVATPYDNPENKKGFRFRADDLKADWTNLSDVEVVVLQHWMESRLPIARVEEQTHTVLLAGSSWHRLTWSTGYFVDNVYEGLTQPGEWYLNRKTGVLTYWPMSGEDMAEAEVVAPAVEQLIRLQGDVKEQEFVEHIAFRGLTFTCSTAPLPQEGHSYSQAEVQVPAAVSAEGARHCVFEGNEFAHLGQWALELSKGCQDNRIVRNRIHNVGAGGIKIGEPREPTSGVEETCRTVVSDNVVRDGNTIYLGAPGIWIGRSGHNSVTHNEISGAWQWGISVGWQWQYTPPTRGRDNLVEYNHVHHLGESELGTHAAIYCLGPSPGTVIRNNHVHHISGGGYGIIFDSGCCAVLAENNVVHHTYGGWSSNFHCIGNVVVNNIFALGSHCQIHRYGDNPGKGVNLANTNIFCRNVLYWSEGKLFKRDKWLDFATVQDYNLYYDTRGPVKFMGHTLGEWRRKKLDRHSVVADPLFIDPDNGDFRLKPGSPAFGLRFRPIDLSNVGPRPPR